MTVVVQGYKEAARAFGKLNREFPKEVRRRLKLAAKPVRADIPRLAGQALRNLGSGDPWAQARIGGGTRLVYIAPKMRGHKGAKTAARRRASTAFADAMMERAMKPALERNRERVADSVDNLVGEMADDWGRGG